MGLWVSGLGGGTHFGGQGQGLKQGSGRQGGRDAQLSPTGQAQHKLHGRVKAGKAVDAQPRGGGQPRPLPGAWPWRVSFRTKGRRPGSRGPASRVCSKGPNGTGPMREEFVCSVPDLENHRPSPRSPIFPPAETLRPPQGMILFTEWCVCGMGGARALLWTGMGAQKQTQHHQRGTWYEGVWEETMGCTWC